jgi:ketosteroid isomerase-like protein
MAIVPERGERVRLRDTPGAMTPGNVEVAREMYRAWNRGDPGFELCAPDVEWDVSRWAPDLPEVARGYEQVRAQHRHFLGMWDEVRFEPERFIEEGDAVVVPVTIRTRGKGSGVALVRDSFHVYRFRDGLVTSFVLYPELAQALDAVGLRD